MPATKAGLPAQSEGGRRLFGGTTAPEGSSEVPLVTVVTVVFNGATHLRKAIESVHGQDYASIEYIVIDGGSQDGTVDILREMDARIDYWISERDGGIYDAMNKGIGLARGKIIGILNSDDRYLPSAVGSAVEALRDPSIGYCYGWANLVGEDGRRVGIAKPVPRPLFDARVQFETPLPHPTMFVRSDIYEKLGKFDLRLRLAADFEFIARIHRAGIVGREIPRPLVDFRLGGASRDPLILRELRDVALANGASPLAAWKNWAISRTVMAMKRVLPHAASGWLRAVKDWKRRR